MLWWPTLRLSRNLATSICFLVAGALVAAGCGQGAAGSPVGATAGPGSPTPGPGALRVVTTTTVFADIVRNVGGSRTDVHSIIPPGVGPEDYEPSRMTRRPSLTPI